MIELLTIAGREHEALIDRFYDGIYTAEFALQREPLEVWKRALWSGDAPYELTVQLALEHDEIVGGVVYERYPRSGCGLVTYVVVAPHVRRRGLGRRLRSGAAAALYRDGAPAVFGEVNDPRVPRHHESQDAAWARLARYQRWGGRVLDIKYVQPSLGPGLARDRGLCLLLHADERGGAATIPGALVRGFVAELYEITEAQQRPDAELRGLLDGISDVVRLVALERQDG